MFRKLNKIALLGITLAFLFEMHFGFVVMVIFWIAQKVMEKGGDKVQLGSFFFFIFDFFPWIS